MNISATSDKIPWVHCLEELQMTDMAGNFFHGTIFLPPLCQTPLVGRDEN